MRNNYREGSLGHAKTTLIKAKIVHDFCFSKKAYEWGFADKERDLFYGWVSSNYKKSKNNVAYVKLHLGYNENIRYYFGKLKGDTWNQEDITTTHGDKLISSSNLSSMRGDTLATIKSGALRYSCVFCDDTENEENTKTQNARDSIVDNIMNGIYPAIEKNQDGCRLFFIATPVHFDSMAQNILDKWAKVKSQGKEAIDEYMWKVITYSATQPGMPGGVLWNSYMNRERLDEIKRVYEDSPFGRGVAGYYQEYELEVQSREQSLWTRDHIKYHDGKYDYRNGQSYLIINNEWVPIRTFLGCDPATDIDTKHSDFSVIMVIGVDPYNNTYVLDYVRERSIPTVGLKDASGEIIGKPGVVDHIINMYTKYHCESATVEDVAMTRSVFQALDTEQRRTNNWIHYNPEKPGGMNKINRIYTGLSSRFSSGSIHVRENHFDLINEIVKFGPKMAHDDTIETLYYACKYAHPAGADTYNIDDDSDYRIVRRAKNWKVA